MKRYIKILFFLIINIINVSLFAQTYNMPVSGYREIHTNSGTLYDDGGASNNYSTRVNAKTTIYPNSSNAKIMITGTYDIEESYKTKLTIYSGDTNSNSILFNNLNSPTSGYINVRSLTGPVTIYFFVDSDTPNSGFELNISICNICPTLPSIINANVIDDSTAHLSWQGGAGTDWIVEYKDECDFEIGTGTKLSTQDSNIILTNLDHCKAYGAKIYTPCDTLQTSCPRLINKICWIQCECPPPGDIIATAAGDSINAYWSSPNSNLEWTVILTDGVSIIDSLVTTNTHAVFDSLIPNYCYSVYVYNNCHNLPFDSICIFKVKSICTPCPCPIVSNLRTSTSSDSIYVWWDEPSDTIEWTVELYLDTNKVTSITTNDTIASFSGLTSLTNYLIVVYCNCNDSIRCIVDTFAMTKCACPVAQNVRVENISNGSVLISWDNDPSSSGWIVEYREKTSSISNFDTTITNSITIPSSQSTGYFDCWVHSLCDSLNVACSQYIEFINIETAGNCMNYTDLKSTDVTANYGIYQNPYLFTGLIDNGPLDITSRHTVNIDTSARDPRTINTLRTIPIGEKASVRLGNWQGGAEAESLTYRYTVDTNNYDLMILKYAIVLQDPNHTPSNQPRFLLEILNNNNVLIDSVCGYANFIASDTLGWNVLNSSNVIWKDWTTVGFDISQYHGQVIKVRLTTYDCKDGGHYGYAYYTLKCGTKKVTSSACGDTQTNIFTAPVGFNYRWYSSANPTTVISNKRVLEILTDSSQNYHCLVSSTENPNCSFVVDAYAGRRYPLANFSYTTSWEPCYFEVHFTNESKISGDGINPLPSGIGCETVQWIFDDGDIQYIDNPVKRYSSSGDYHVKLVAGLANNQCTDTIEMVLSLVGPTGILRIIGDSSLCQGESTTLTATLEGTYKWNNGETTQSISFTPTIDSLYTVQVMDTANCPHFGSRMVRVHPNYNNFVVYDSVCDNFVYNAQGTILTESGIYPLNLISVYGCDSNIILHLTINPSFSDTTNYNMCKNETFEFHNLDLDSTGVYEVRYNNIYGCDSVYVVHLTVFPIYNDTISADIYKGNVFNKYGFNEKETGFYTQNLQTINGCDSILNLDLQVDYIMFPNCVTPNGDGINDVFEIHNLIEEKAFPENELIIYTRQGEIIYQFKNLSSKSDFWSPAKTNTPTGTYFYRFTGKRNDKTIDTTGVIEVIR